MSYVNLKEMLAKAKQYKYAVGAFNIVDGMTADAVIRAAEAKRSPVIIQTSAKTVTLYGSAALSATIKALAERSNVPVALHLDHCKDLELIRDCIAAGWSSVMIDASSFAFEENIKMTQEIVNAARPHNITVEGELGAIVGVEDDLHVNEQDQHLADPEQALQFVSKTGVDVFAPAIGTAHGLYKGVPKIAFDNLETIAEQVDAAIAIHGGTGLSDNVFSRCIQLGGTKVNVSTQLKHVFRDSIASYYQSNPDDYEPLKALTYMRDQVQQMTESFIDKFGSSSRA